MTAPTTTVRPGTGAGTVTIAVTLNGQELLAITGTPLELLVCPECETTVPAEEAGDEDTLYACATDSGCGQKFRRANGVGRNGTMCPDCTKFGTKLDQGPICPECDAGILEQAGDAAFRCSGCDEIVEDYDEFLDHVAQEHLADALT